MASKVWVLATVLLLLPVVSADKVMYKGIPVYFMHYKIDRTACFEVFDKIPPYYFMGLDSIMVYSDHYIKSEGLYRNGQITLFIGCNKELIVHELAHYNNMRQLGYTSESGDVPDVFTPMQNKILEETA